MSDPNTDSAFEIAVDEAFYRDPFRAYRALRAYGPVQRIMAGPDTPLWLVTQYEAIRKALNDPRLTKDPDVITKAMRRCLAKDTSTDAEIDERMRGYSSLMRSFTHHVREVVRDHLSPERAADTHDPFTQIANALLDSFAGTENSIDLVADFAMPYAIHSTCELIGIPEQDRADVTEWLDLMIHSPDSRVEQDASVKLSRKLAALMTERQVYPEPTMLTELSNKVTARVGATEDEVVRGCVLLLVISVETTFSAIGNAFYSLLTDPARLDVLLRDETLIENATEELLRFDGAHNIGSVRCATANLWIGEHEIKSGDLVAFAVSSGHGDEAKFPNPDELELTRRTNGHLAFGYGAHHCLRARYARAQAATALRTVLSRYPRLHLNTEPDSIEWLASPFLRSVKQLPVRLLN